MENDRMAVIKCTWADMVRDGSKPDALLYGDDVINLELWIKTGNGLLPAEKESAFDQICPLRQSLFRDCGHLRVYRSQSGQSGQMRGNRRGDRAGSGVVRPPGAVRVAAGEVLGNTRYRLREQLGREGESSMWGAADEVLGRSIMVWVFPPNFKRAGAVVAAAQAACHLDDPRLARVFDADARGEFPYVVTERPAGWHLGELLTVSPVDPVSAAAVVAEAAAALVVAHAAGLAHLHLRPWSLWWGPAGRVKVSGLGIAAAGAGVGSADPALADTRGLGKVLYAALTGYWPGAEQTPLPAAPRRGDHVYKPSQLQQGVPSEFDAVVCRALPQAGSDAGPPILDPAQLAGELTRAVGAYSLRYGLTTLRLPGRMSQPTMSPAPCQPPVIGPVAVNAPPRPASATTRPVIQRVAGSTAKPSPVAARERPRLAAKPAESAGKARSVPRVRRRRHRVALSVMLAAVVLLATGGWFLAHGPGRFSLGRSGGANSAVGVAARPLVSWRPVRPADAQAFDPYGGTRGDNSKLAPLAIDDNLSTAWRTDKYATPHFGNRKPGTGLLLNMGRVVTVEGVEIRLGTSPGASFQVRAGLSTAQLANLQVLVQETRAGGLMTIRLRNLVHARYVVIWFTRLPPGPSGTFQASVFGVSVEGRP